MRIRLIINDCEYCSILAETLGQIGKDIIVEVDREWPSLSDREIVVLTDDESLGVDKGYSNTVILTNNPNDVISPDYKGGIVKIFKYNSIDNILSDLEYVNYINSGCRASNNGLLSRMLAVCSDNGDRASFLSVLLAKQILFRKGGDIIIISLGFVNDNPCFNEKDRSKFSRWMYYIDVNRPYIIDSFTFEDSYGISYLKLPPGLNPLAYMSVDELMIIISELCKSKYETIVLDIGNSFSEVNIKMINRADNIVYFTEDCNKLNINEIVMVPETKQRIQSIAINNLSDLDLVVDGYVRRVFGESNDEHSNE